MSTVEKYGEISHVLFDMDGLLLDTETLYTVAQVKLLEPLGVEFTPEVKAMMMGRKDLEAAEVMVEHYGLEGRLDPAEFVKNRSKILEELFPDCEMMPGVERLLNHLFKHGVQMALATSSSRHHYDLKTKKHRNLFLKVFQHIITGDQVSVAKPNPEIFELAASKFGLDINPDNVLVFEDAPLGIEAALNAKMKCVWISQSETSSACSPHQRLSSMEDFKPEQWGLPGFEE